MYKRTLFAESETRMHGMFVSAVMKSYFSKWIIIIIGLFFELLPILAQETKSFKELDLIHLGEEYEKLGNIEKAVECYIMVSDMGNQYQRDILIDLVNDYNKQKKVKRSKNSIVLPSRLQYASNIKNRYNKMELDDSDNKINLIEIVSSSSYDTAVDSALSIAVNEPTSVVGAGSKLEGYVVFACTQIKDVFTVAVLATVILPDGAQPTASFKFGGLAKDKFNIAKVNSENAVTTCLEFLSNYLEKNIVWDLNLKKTSSPPVEGTLSFRFCGDEAFFCNFFDILYYSRFSSKEKSHDVAHDDFFELGRNVWLPIKPFQRNYGNNYQYLPAMTTNSAWAGLLHVIPPQFLCVTTRLSVKWLNENSSINLPPIDLRELLSKQGYPSISDYSVRITINLSREDFEKTDSIVLKPYNELNFGRQLSVLSSMSDNNNDELFCQLYNISKLTHQNYPNRLQALEQTKKNRYNNVLDKKNFEEKYKELNSIVSAVANFKDYLTFNDEKYSRNALINSFKQQIELCNEGIVLAEELIEDYQSLGIQKDVVDRCKSVIELLGETKDLWSQNLKILTK